MDEKQGVWEIIFVYFLHVLFTTCSINDCLLVSYDWSYRLKKKKNHFGEGAAHSALTFLYIDFFCFNKLYSRSVQDVIFQF